MSQINLRTYQRRSVTRESGYHTCDETTGGECIVLHADRCNIIKNETFTFKKEKVQLKKLFNKNYGIFAFGGYIFCEKNISITFDLSYMKNEKLFSDKFDVASPINSNDWNSIGFHKEIELNDGDTLKNVIVNMHVTTTENGYIDLISFDMNAINKEEFEDDKFDVSFHQKTNMHIPHLYYLETELPIRKYLISDQEFTKGQLVVLKSCNRCGRFLPINIKNEIGTLAFSLHCKKLAPCTHSTFRAYEIQNEVDKNELTNFGIKLEDNKVVAYYGHQLECKACKKFFVNMPLNPQRNAQQFREDGLRRRAIEVLINNLLQTNLIHFEFENKTKKEFVEYIWNKFDRKCFKCKKELELNEIALDHTMPLAYLYRLDDTATCLCSSHNSQKSDTFPVDYYSEDELIELSKITGLSLEKLHSREINNQVLDLLIKNVVWFYDEFLMQPDYQKVRDGILTADKINDSLKRVIGNKVDLAEEYKKITGHYPTSVTIIE